MSTFKLPICFNTMNKAFVTFAPLLFTPFYLLNCIKVNKPGISSESRRKNLSEKSQDKIHALFKNQPFINPIGNTNNKIEFKEDGKVYLIMGDSKQTYDITGVQQQQRLFRIKKMIQKGK